MLAGDLGGVVPTSALSRATPATLTRLCCLTPSHAMAHAHYSGLLLRATALPGRQRYSPACQQRKYLLKYTIHDQNAATRAASAAHRGRGRSDGQSAAASAPRRGRGRSDPQTRTGRAVSLDIRRVASAEGSTKRGRPGPASAVTAVGRVGLEPTTGGL